VAMGCTKNATTMTLDANWRWAHKKGCEPECSGKDNCVSNDGHWTDQCIRDTNTGLPNCSCVLEGVGEKEWETNYGIRSEEPGSVNITLVAGPSTTSTVGVRTFLLSPVPCPNSSEPCPRPNTSGYEQFSLLNREFTFTVDVSRLPCGVAGKLQLIDMEPTGDFGTGEYPGNTAGASYGTGYCNAKCANDVRWIKGSPNQLRSEVVGHADLNGYLGSCCTEFELFEGNAYANAFRSHSCRWCPPTPAHGVLLPPAPTSTRHTRRKIDACTSSATALPPTFAAPARAPVPTHTLSGSLPPHTIPMRLRATRTCGT
jgi:cellulose 1,4-beta-cellobiosidase